MKAENRLFCSDNYRIMLTILVIAYNVGQAFLRPAGVSGMVTASLRTVLVGPFFLANRSLFMSLFFMISGYFMVGSYERSGGALAFLSGRLVRLALPVVAYGAVTIPLKLLFGGRLTSWTEVLGIDNLWYMRHGFFRVALADLPRDIGFFIIGAIAYPRGGLQRFPKALGFAWLAVGALAAAVRYVLSFVERSPIPSDAEMVRVFSPAREALLAGAVGIGLLVLFRGAIDVTARVARVT
ncbi:MAG TPA: acyltransferase family protein [Spirochaetia bacterium]|nr:acyltransferase family protein [Spirochaetia bacterium]